MIAERPYPLAAWFRASAVRLRTMLRDQWQSMAAFMLLLFSVELVRGWSTTGYEWTGLPAYALDVIARVFAVLGPAALLGPVLAAALCPAGWRRGVLTVALAIGAVGAGLEVLDWLIAGPITQAVRDGLVLSDEAFALRSLWFYSTAGILFAGYSRIRERHMAITRATQAAELERAAVQRATMESRLEVLQARVEPDFLFAALGRVDALYRRSPAEGERMLEDLIRYLRAALPKTREERSTIGREIELVRAYLVLLQAPRGRVETVAVECDRALAAAGFPPMALLHVVRTCIACHRADGPLRIAVRVTSERSQVRVIVDAEGDTAPDLPPGDKTAGLDEVVAGTTGMGGTIGFTTSGHACRATIVVPLTGPLRDAA